MRKVKIKNNEKNKFFLFMKKFKYVIYIIDALLIIFGIWCYIQPGNVVTTAYTMNNLEKHTIKYSDNIYIQNVINECKNVSDEVICVWEFVPYVYDTNRSLNFWHDIIHLQDIITPEQYFESGGKGICRDNAVMLKTILNGLNINSTFTLEPKHVYITAYYHNKTYILNTYLMIKNETKQ